MSRYKVSVIMPGLNEERNLVRAVENVISGFEVVKTEGQILIINDGSSDRTGEIAERLSGTHPFIKTLHHKTPQGIGGSFWDGVKAADGEIVTMLPGDGENDAIEILRYLPLMEHVDIIVPFVFNSEVRSVRRRMLSSLYRRIINISFGMNLNYMNGTVMYRKSVFESISLRCKGFFYQTELLIKCIRSGYLFAEVPYALGVRGGGVSKATTFKSLRKVVRDYVKTLLEVYLIDSRPAEISPESVTALRWKRKEA